MTATSLHDWIQLALSAVTLTAIIMAGIKVIHIAQKGVESHEQRIQTLEKDRAWVERVTEEITKITTRVEAMQDEMRRMRDRLDRFLDGPTEGRCK